VKASINNHKEANVKGRQAKKTPLLMLEERKTLGGREGSNENVVVVGLSGVAAEEVALGL
jgi:hypothetical protein